MNRAIAQCAVQFALVRRACAACSARSCCAATPDDCQTLRKHGHRAEAQDLLRVAHAIARSVSARRRLSGASNMYEEANNEFRTAVAQSPTERDVSRALGPPAARAIQQHRRRRSFQGSLEARSEKRAGLSRPRAGQRGRLRQQSRSNTTTKAIELDPKLVEAHELMANLAARRFRHRARPSEEADEALKISPDALDAMAIHAAIEILADRSPDAWLDKIRQVNPTYGEGYAIVAHHLVLNRRYEDGIAYYRKAIEADPQLWSARSRAWHQPDAPGPGRRAAQAARNVLRQRLSRRSDRQQPAPARQLQEFRHLQGRHHDPQAPQERSRPAAPLFRRRAEARHRHLREEIQDEAARPGAGGGLSRPRRFRRAHAWACPAWARWASRSAKSSRWTAPRAASPAISIGPARCGTR